MKVAIIVLTSLTGLALANPYPTQERLPSFKVYRHGSSRKDGDIPGIDVEFPDGHVDTMVLRRYYSNEEESQSAAPTCSYIGSLRNDPTACVAVTGCFGEDLEMTILSEHASPSTMFILNKDNTTKALRRTDKHHDVVTVDPDYKDAVHAFSSSRSEKVPLPPTNLLEIKIGYDDDFREKFVSPEDAETYVTQILAHSQAHLCHASLGTKIKLRRVGEITHHRGEQWHATEFDRDRVIRLFSATSDLEADVYAYLSGKLWCHYLFGCLLGAANIGKMCASKDGEQSFIAEDDGGVAATAQTFSHELGHVMGMYHDFEKGVHCIAEDNCPCDNKGLMSYGTPPDAWSECSRDDLVSHYNMILKNPSFTWCLDPAPSACQGIATPTTTTTTTSTTTPGPVCYNSVYKGDGSCDDGNNIESCDYDGGDCCGDNVDTRYCDACECLDPNFATSTTSAPASCAYPSLKGDNECDDVTNTPECDYDGGDCCGDNVDTRFCEACECLDPNFSTSTTSAPAVCAQPAYKGDNECDDVNNTPECEYDGGDCCGEDVVTGICKICACLDPDYDYYNDASGQV